MISGYVNVHLHDIYFILIFKMKCSVFINLDTCIFIFNMGANCLYIHVYKSIQMTFQTICFSYLSLDVF